MGRGLSEETPININITPPNPTQPPPSHNPTKHVRSLGVLQLIAISFFSVSGGPYGIESIVDTAPIGITLLSFIVIPIIWSTPVALITAELSTMIPQDGGSVLWVKEGLGDAVGWINGICSWLVFLFDSALYPGVMMTYVEHITGKLHPVLHFVFSLGFVLLALCINLRSALEVGWLAEVLGVVSIAPFVVFIIVAYARGFVGHVDLTFSGQPTAQYGMLLSLSIWNSAGWEDVGMLAGEVRNPSRTFPLSLVGSLVLQTVANMAPIYVGFGINSDYAKWVTGFFLTLAHRVGGQPLYVFMMVGSFVSLFGLLHADIVASSRLVGWMATQRSPNGRKWFPRIFGKLYSKHAVPRMAVVANCVLIAGLTKMPFGTLVQVDVILMCFSYVLIFLTFVVLRIRFPRTSRPFRLPAYTRYLTWIYVIIPMAIVIMQIVTAPWVVLVISGGTVVASTVVYFFVFKLVHFYLKRRRKYQLIDK